MLLWFLNVYILKSQRLKIISMQWIKLKSVVFFFGKIATCENSICIKIELSYLPDSNTFRETEHLGAEVNLSMKRA